MFAIFGIMQPADVQLKPVFSLFYSEQRVSATWIEDQEWEHVFCAYKLCRVEFPFWGFQTRVERFFIFFKFDSFNQSYIIYLATFLVFM